MKITIQGQDYSSTLHATRPLTIERKLNEPSVCSFWLILPASTSLLAPVRNQSLSIAGDDGAVYFTGYLAVTPMLEYTGMGVTGPRYRFAIQAISDELLLDQAGVSPSKGAAGETASALITTLVTRTGMTSLATTGLPLNAIVGNFVPVSGAIWSKSIGSIAGQ